MKKTIYRLAAVIAVLSVCLLAGCWQAIPIQVTSSPAPYAPEQNTPEAVTLAPSVSPLLPVSTDEPSRPGIPLPSGEIKDKTFMADLDKDGAEETITFNSSEIENNGSVDYLTVMTVSGGQGTYTENIESYMYSSSYIISTQSGIVCFLVNLEGFIDYDSEIYSFDGIKPVKLRGLGHVTGVSGTEITEEGPIDALGTWHYSRVYILKDDLSLEPGEFQIIMDREPLHTIKKVPVELLTEGVYTKTYIDAGKDIIPVATDGRSYLKFVLDDGSEGRILLSKPEDDSYDGYYDSYFNINGQSEYEYFENIEYTDILY